MSETGNFIYSKIEKDISPSGRFFGKKIHTRFPPEPNGFLHIGHAKAMYISYLSAKKFDGLFNLRMDDTNPSREDSSFIESIIEDVKWLGIDFGDKIGIKKSSARITDLYTPYNLVGTQVACCVNLPPMHIGSVKSEVRILGSDSEQGVVLLRPDRSVENGDRVF